MNRPRRRVAVIAVALAGVVMAVTSCGGDGESGAATNPPAESVVGPTTTPAVGEIAENRPVTITGEPLVELEDPNADPAVGLAAPVLDGASFDGMPLRIGPSEQPTLVVFLAHWCPHCNDEIPRLVQLEDEGRLPADLAIVAVSTAVAPDRPNYPPSEWLVDKDWRWPALADSEGLDAASAYGLNGFPFMTMLDADGTVVARWSGESDVDTLERQITDAYAATAS
jgi:thiol-disulfide isomerase/thioredoxin